LGTIFLKKALRNFQVKGGKFGNNGKKSKKWGPLKIPLISKEFPNLSPFKKVLPKIPPSK